jgi:hypothetical protein
MPLVRPVARFRIIRPGTEARRDLADSVPAVAVTRNQRRWLGDGESDQRGWRLSWAVASRAYPSVRCSLLTCGQSDAHDFPAPHAGLATNPAPTSRRAGHRVLLFGLDGLALDGGRLTAVAGLDQAAEPGEQPGEVDAGQVGAEL